jgi:hypothetical protein
MYYPKGFLESWIEVLPKVTSVTSLIVDNGESIVRYKYLCELEAKIEQITALHIRTHAESLNITKIKRFISLPWPI